ncbi:hypothetical protein NDU88_004063 [Pleurodeles waltl]|uniref:Uncharacterized protein n=1 Tax=Pleurodeles waltl TaxID=8319 RepID=A0AAV7NJZ8_PLEWA|nr:hypothetical protein NDU88_004063 [Pleurodeles waltl]
MGCKRGSGGESWRSQPARGLDRRNATTEEQNQETPGIPGRRADRSRHPHSPDPGTKTTGPGEHTRRPATFQEFDTGKGAECGRRREYTGTNTTSTDGWENRVERRGETKG